MNVGIIAHNSKKALNLKIFALPIKIYWQSTKSMQPGLQEGVLKRLPTSVS